MEGFLKRAPSPSEVETLRQRSEITQLQQLLGSVSKEAPHGGNVYIEAPQPGKHHLNVRKNCLQIPVVQSLHVSQSLGHIGHFGCGACPFSEIDNSPHVKVVTLCSCFLCLLQIYKKEKAFTSKVWRKGERLTINAETLFRAGLKGGMKAHY